MRYRQAIWLLSDGRSGSNWFAQMLNHACRHRIEHEPVHRTFNPRLAGEPLVPMPGTADMLGRYVPLFDDILAGRYRTERLATTQGPQEPAGLVIRDINALLIAPQMLRAVPQLYPVIMVRHPVEVAASKWALPRWEWFTDVAQMADDPVLRPHLEELVDALSGRASEFRRHVLFWAVCHRYLFRSLDPRTVTLVRYPGPASDMQAAVASILRATGSGDCIDEDLLAQAWARRSVTDRPTGARLGIRRMLGLPAVSRSDIAFADRVIDIFNLRWLVPWDAHGEAPTDVALCPSPSPVTPVLTLHDQGFVARREALLPEQRPARLG